MASGSQNMTTYNARTVTGSSSAASPAGALLLSGEGRADDATGDTWLFLDSAGGTSTPWGIKHDQVNNKMQIFGAGTNSVWTQMNTGNTYIGGSLDTGSILTVRAQNDAHEGGEIILKPATDSFSTVHIDAYDSIFRLHDGTNERFKVNISSGNTTINGNLGIGTDYAVSGGSYKLYVNGSTYFNGNTTHNGIDYFANGTTYYINNSGDSRLRYEHANTYTGYDSAGFISSIAGSPWPYIRFDTRAGGSTYVTIDQTNWCQLYAQVPAKRDTTYYKTRFFFRQYSKTANTTTRLNYYEDYYLPETNDGRTGNASYNILTTKDMSFSITGNAATATNADKVDNYHASDLWRKDGATWNGNANVTCSATANGQEWSFDLNAGSYTGTYWHVWSTKNGASILQCYNDDRRVVVPVRLDTAWLRVVNNSSNTSDDALVYIQNQTANDWAVKIVKGSNDYGLRVESLDKSNAIWTNGYIRARCVWANQGSNGERQVGVDSSTSGTIYFWSNTTNKGIYSGSGYSTGTILNVTSSGRVLYCHDTWGDKVRIVSNWIGFYGSTHGGTRYGYIQSDASRMYFRKENGANNNIGFDFGHNIYCSSEYISGTANGLRIKNVILRNDGGNFYFLVGTSNTPGDNWNSLRPFYWNLSNGYCYHTRAYQAVWNDYAEFRKGDTIEPGYCVIETSSGIMTKSTSRLQPGAKMISDTYGEAMGETKEAKTPIAVSGRMLAYTYRNRNEYPLGAAVCSAPNGTIDIMTREEIMMYPERIVGTVSEIPNYDVWNSGGSVEQGPSEEIKVNGRIWIYVR